MKHLRKPRGLTVLSFIGKCACGKDIPYNRKCCIDGHAVYGRDINKNAVCSRCGSNNTQVGINYTRNNGSIRTHYLWLSAGDGQTICSRCYFKTYNSTPKRKASERARRMRRGTYYREYYIRRGLVCRLRNKIFNTLLYINNPKHKTRTILFPRK